MGQKGKRSQWEKDGYLGQVGGSFVWPQFRYRERWSSLNI